jgi:YidC/Oxa1 family membrane protein insertase
VTQDNRNLLLAVVLSAFVLFGWSFVQERFFPAAKPSAPVSAPSAPAGAAPEAPGTAPAVAAPAAVALRPLPQVIAASPRVAIDTPRLKGSINLVGARFDDLVLTDQKVSIARNAAPVRLFAPSGTRDAYFAGFGWTGPGAPPADARWTASAQALTPGNPVTLRWVSPDKLVFEQVIDVDRNFLFTVKARVLNGTSAPVVLKPFGFVNRTGRGPDKNSFNNHVGPVGVLGGTLKEVSFDDLRDRFEKGGGAESFPSTGGWLGITDHHWLAAVIPDQKAAVEGRFLAAADNRYQADWAGPAVTLLPGQASETQALLFAGAKEVAVVNAVRDEKGVDKFDLAISWGWFGFIAKPISSLLHWLYGIFGNYALAIVGLTLIVRAVLYPIANRQYASMAKMRIFAPKMKEIQQKYKDDKAKQQLEIMELYKREKINPLAGCLPVLLQIPIFYALYKTLLISTEMRHQPGFLWIKDLSAPDPLTPLNLFGLLPFELPPILHLGVLPILLGITMFVQFRLNPQPMDEIQQKVFAWMPWLFMFMMAPFAAGLQIYWIVNNLVSILQQWVLLKKYPAPAPAPAK